MRYFALVLNDREASDPYSVFREVSEPGVEYRFDVWDRSLRRWQMEMSFMKYSMCGEIGAVSITRAEARRIIKAQGRWPEGSGKTRWYCLIARPPLGVEPVTKQVKGDRKVAGKGTA